MAPLERAKNAASELLQYLSENLSDPAPVSSDFQCLIVFDSGVEAVGEILQKLLPLDLQPKSAFHVCERLSDVVKLLRETRPTVLITHSNFFVFTTVQAISALVAVSPGTRHLVVTSWPQTAVDEFRNISRLLHVPIDVLSAPFSREELAAALGKILKD